MLLRVRPQQAAQQKNRKGRKGPEGSSKDTSGCFWSTGQSLVHWTGSPPPTLRGPLSLAHFTPHGQAASRRKETGPAESQSPGRLPECCCKKNRQREPQFGPNPQARDRLTGDTHSPRSSQTPVQGEPDAVGPSPNLSLSQPWRVPPPGAVGALAARRGCARPRARHVDTAVRPGMGRTGGLYSVKKVGTSAAAAGSIHAAWDGVPMVLCMDVVYGGYGYRM